MLQVQVSVFIFVSCFYSFSHFYCLIPSYSIDFYYHYLRLLLFSLFLSVRSLIFVSDIII